MAVMVGAGFCARGLVSVAASISAYRGGGRTRVNTWTKEAR